MRIYQNNYFLMHLLGLEDIKKNNSHRDSNKNDIIPCRNPN
jgi:hypothetical protein